MPLNDYLAKYTNEAGFDAWYVDHLINTISCISPKISKAQFPWAKKTDFGGDSFYSIDIAHTTIPNYLNKALKEKEAEENVGDNYDGYHQEDIADVDREEPCI